MKSLLRSAVVLALLGAGAAQAATVTVTSVSNAPAPNTWYIANFRDTTTGFPANTFAGITNTNPRNGNGSVEMSTTPTLPPPANQGAGKVDYVYTWGYVPGRTLGNVEVVGFDWFRQAGGTTAGHLAPAMRLLYDADGSDTTANDRGYLIWEQVYNGPTVENAWVSSDLEDDYWWQRKFLPVGGVSVEDYDMSLDNWAAGTSPVTPTPQQFDVLSASTAILGIEFGIGSGWNGSFRGFVDNVRIGFTGQEATTFNFETAASQVPEPASLALLGLGALGFAARRRRQQ